MQNHTVTYTASWQRTLTLIMILYFASFSCLHPEEGAAPEQPEKWRIQKCVRSDEAWTDRLIFYVRQGLKGGNKSEVVARLKGLLVSVRNVELEVDGVECVELVLIDRDKIAKKLGRLAEECGVSVMAFRFVPIDEKGGFVQALSLIAGEFGKAPKGESQLVPSGKK